MSDVLVWPCIELTVDRSHFSVERYTFPDGHVEEIQLYDTYPSPIDPYRRAIVRKRFFDAIETIGENATEKSAPKRGKPWNYMGE